MNLSPAQLLDTTQRQRLEWCLEHRRADINWVQYAHAIEDAVDASDEESQRWVALLRTVPDDGMIAACAAAGFNPQWLLACMLGIADPAVDESEVVQISDVIVSEAGPGEYLAALAAADAADVLHEAWARFGDSSVVDRIIELETAATDYFVIVGVPVRSNDDLDPARLAYNHAVTLLHRVDRSVEGGTLSDRVSADVERAVMALRAAVDRFTSSPMYGELAALLALDLLRQSELDPTHIDSLREAVIAAERAARVLLDREPRDVDLIRPLAGVFYDGSKYFDHVDPGVVAATFSTVRAQEERGSTAWCLYSQLLVTTLFRARNDAAVRIAEDILQQPNIPDWLRLTAQTHVIGGAVEAGFDGRERLRRKDWDRLVEQLQDLRRVPNTPSRIAELVNVWFAMALLARAKHSRRPASRGDDLEQAREALSRVLAEPAAYPRAVIEAAALSIEIKYILTGDEDPSSGFAVLHGLLKRPLHPRLERYVREMIAGHAEARYQQLSSSMQRDPVASEEASSRLREACEQRTWLAHSALLDDEEAARNNFSLRRDAALLRGVPGASGRADWQQAEKEQSAIALASMLYDEYRDYFSVMSTVTDVGDNTSIVVDHGVHIAVMRRAEAGDTVAREALLLWLFGAGLTSNDQEREVSVVSFRMMLARFEREASWTFEALRAASNYWSLRGEAGTDTIEDPIIATIAACRDAGAFEVALRFLPDGWHALRLELHTRLVEAAYDDNRVRDAARLLADQGHRKYGAEVQDTSIGRLLWLRRGLVAAWLLLRDGNFEDCQRTLLAMAPDEYTRPSNSFIASYEDLSGRLCIATERFLEGEEHFDRADGYYRTIGNADALVDMWAFFAAINSPTLELERRLRGLERVKDDVANCSPAIAANYHRARGWVLIEAEDYRSAAFEFVVAHDLWSRLRAAIPRLEAEALMALCAIAGHDQGPVPMEAADATAAIAQMYATACRAPTVMERQALESTVHRSIEAAIGTLWTRVVELMQSADASLDEHDEEATAPPMAPPSREVPPDDDDALLQRLEAYVPPSDRQLAEMYIYNIVELQELARSQFMPATEELIREAPDRTPLKGAEASETDGIEERSRLVPRDAVQPVSLYPPEVGVLSAVGMGAQTGSFGATIWAPPMPPELVREPVPLLPLISGTVRDKPWVLWYPYRLGESVVHTMLTRDGVFGAHATPIGDALDAYMRATGRGWGRGQRLWQIISPTRYSPALRDDLIALRSEYGPLWRIAPDAWKSSANETLKQHGLDDIEIAAVLDWMLSDAEADPSERELAAMMGTAFIPDGLPQMLHEVGPEAQLVTAPSDDIAGLPFGWFAVPGGDTRLLELAVVRQVPAASLLAHMQSRASASAEPLVIAVRNSLGDLPFSERPPSSAYSCRVVEFVRAHATLPNVLEALRQVEPGQPGAFVFQGHHPSTQSLAHMTVPALRFKDADLSVGALFGLSDAGRISMLRLALLLGCGSRGSEAAEQLNTATAFLLCGSKDVISTLWPLVDADFTDLEYQVVQGSLDGRDPVAILTSWQRERLARWRTGSTDDIDAPMTWAALVALSGPGVEGASSPLALPR